MENRCFCALCPKCERPIVATLLPDDEALIQELERGATIKAMSTAIARNLFGCECSTTPEQDKE